MRRVRASVGWQLRRRAELRNWWRELKATKSCERCGESDPDCLQFHHRNPSTKEVTLSDAITRWSRDHILCEIAKCEVLCANCHLKHHWDARQRKKSG